MSQKINLYWYRHKEGHGNFGDELNPYIVKNLSGKEVNWIDVNLLFDDKWLAFKTLIKNLYRHKIDITFFLKYAYYNFIATPTVLLVIGSILENTFSSKNIIWGAGFINSTTQKVKGIFLAVRGFRTIDKLKKMSLALPEVVGDPAILLPLIYKPKSKNKEKIGVIPHYQHYQSFKEKFDDRFIVINLLDDIEKVIDEIASCKFTLSTSLHGIIVSHAYSIPSIWSEFSELSLSKLFGDNIKFYDYFSSVEIEDYEPIIFNNFQQMNTDELNENYHSVSLPSREVIRQIQQGLIVNAPFDVLEKFK